MTLTPTQRSVLDALAHMRVAPEDAWQSTRQLSRFVEGDAIRYGRAYRALERLWTFHLVEKRHLQPGSRVQWRITQAGRDAL